jgi:Protein of unknown function (DUF1573)
MKHSLLFFMIMAILMSCNIRRSDRISDDSSEIIDKAMKDTTSVHVIDSVYDFGKVTEGEKVAYFFRFVNTGKKLLVIEKASASCGCTIAEKPEAPVFPGDTSFIKVVFNSFGKAGHNEKRITVLSNAYPSFPILELTGQVEASTVTN